MPRKKGVYKLEEYDKPQSLHINTRQLLKDDPRTLTMLSQATAVPFFWLKKFSAGEIPNPGVNRVQYLYEFLTKSKLV